MLRSSFFLPKNNREMPENIIFRSIMSYYIRKTSTPAVPGEQGEGSKASSVKSSSSAGVEDGEETLSEGASVRGAPQGSSSAVAGLVRNALKGLKGVSSSLKKVTALAEKASFSGLNSASNFNFISCNKPSISFLTSIGKSKYVS